MKKLISLILMCLLSYMAYSETVINPLTKGQADILYCSQYGNCILSNLSVIGGYFNLTVTNVFINVTSIIGLNGTIEGFGNETYLRLDTANDPVTGELFINNSLLVESRKKDVTINATNSTTWHNINLEGQVRIYNPHAGPGSQHWRFYPQTAVNDSNRIAAFQNVNDILQLIGIGSSTSKAVASFFLSNGNFTAEGNIKPGQGVDFLVAGEGTQIIADDLGDDLVFQQRGGTSENLILDWASNEVALKSNSGLSEIELQNIDLRAVGSDIFIDESNGLALGDSSPYHATLVSGATGEVDLLDILGLKMLYWLPGEPLRFERGFISDTDSTVEGDFNTTGDIFLLNGKFLHLDSDAGFDNYIYANGINNWYYADSGHIFAETDGNPPVISMHDGTSTAVAMRFDQELQYMRGANFNLSMFDNPGAGENPYFIQGGDSATAGIMQVGWQLGNQIDDWYHLKDIGSNPVSGLNVEMALNVSNTTYTEQLIIEGSNDLTITGNAVSGINPSLDINGGILYFTSGGAGKLYFISSGLSYYGEIDMQLGTSGTHAGGFRQQTPTASTTYVFYGVPSSTTSDTRYGIFGDWSDRAIDITLGDQSDPTLFFQSADTVGHLGIQHNNDYGRLWVDQGSILLDNDTVINNNLNVTGNFTGNQFYAEAWGQDIGDVIMSSSNVYYNITNMTVGELNGWSFFNATFTNEVGGLYSINSMFSFSGTPNNEYHLSISVNGTQQDKCHTERVIGSGGDVGSAGFTCFYRFYPNDLLTVIIENADSAGNPTIHDININLVRIGD